MHTKHASPRQRDRAWLAATLAVAGSAVVLAAFSVGVASAQPWNTDASLAGSVQICALALPR
jgi:hypothetical protein